MHLHAKGAELPVFLIAQRQYMAFMRLQIDVTARLHILHEAQGVVGRIALAGGRQHPQTVSMGRKLARIHRIHGQHRYTHAAAPQHPACGAGNGLGLPGLAGIGDQHEWPLRRPFAQGVVKHVFTALSAHTPGHARTKRGIAQHQSRRTPQARGRHSHIHHRSNRAFHAGATNG
ncbi:hypothetical protein SDC9_121172 [bioreactor metagenome]|uniref:Uncharacterized protein n=1 Tax=bioreactor metagenome TaxID=1076179 RepID=A0A645CB71_9ZZZZ